ncbi:MAG TPA: Fic family protein [Polyangiaceae bacterium]|jgi:Fic family protein
MASARYRPPFDISPKALRLATEIARLLGRYEGLSSPKPQPKLRRHNQIRTVLGSVAIEGNALSLDQVTAILEGKRVVGPRRDVLEVQNAIKTYARAASLNPFRSADLLTAHGSMMRGLLADAGHYRSTAVGVLQGSRVAHVAPPAKRVPELVARLLAFLKPDPTLLPLIQAAVAHYEIEFIHPFSDGNGRVGRLWQHVLLVHDHPLFEYLPTESVIFAKQAEYYRVLGACDKAGNSTLFVEFSLATIHESLDEFMSALRPGPVTAAARLEIARRAFRDQQFSRKDYLAHFPLLSSATASRDLKSAVDGKALARTGDKALARYRFR